MGIYRVTALKNRTPIAQVDLSFSQMADIAWTFKSFITCNICTNIHVVRYGKDGKVDNDFSLREFMS